MSKNTVLVALAVLAMGTAAFAQQTIESWENDLGTWDATTNFDGYQFVSASDPLYGSAVTDGDYALSLNCKSGWTQGLVTSFGIDQTFVAGMSGADLVALDVSSSQELSGYYGQGGSFQLAMFLTGSVSIDGVQQMIGPLLTGDPDAGGVNVGGYLLVDPVYSYDFSTATLEWDMTSGTYKKDGVVYDFTDGPGMPEFDPAMGGWFQIRFQTNVSTTWGDPGWVIIDNLVATDLGTGPDPCPGDFNDDRSVTGADYVVWANNFGQSDDALADGSHNDDGSVTGADYVIWANNFGNTCPATVPEPATIGLMMMGAAALLRRRH